MLCNRLFTDPEDTCVCCAGSGTRRSFDAACGFSNDPCPACEGVATRGVFVVHIAAGEVRTEFNFHTQGFALACRFADRAARLARGRCSRYAVTAETRVVWKPTDELEPEEVVHVASVWNYTHGRAT